MSTANGTTSTPYIEVLSSAFPNLNTASIELLIEAAREEVYPAGSVLCRQGEVGTTLFVMMEGVAGIDVATDADTEVRVNVVRPYAYIGEMALLGEHTVRSATIRALEQCRVLVIDRDAFLAVADKSPALLRSLTVQLMAHLRNNDRAVIQELRYKNDELATAYADLAEQERMRREFVTTLSHEIRTPLTSVQGFLQLINKGMIKPESIPVALGSVTHNVEKLVHLTNNLLVLYEMQLTTPEFVGIAIPDLLLDALRKLQSTAEYENADISIEIQPDLPGMRGDKAGLTLSLHAILENAVKFSDNKPVQLRAFAASDNLIQIDVIDQGIGIPPEMQERIFEPFYRLERTDRHQGSDNKLFDGVGIGLSIAKFIVNRHRGEIHVQSELDKGCTFSLLLPSTI